MPKVVAALAWSLPQKIQPVITGRALIKLKWNNTPGWNPNKVHRTHFTEAPRTLDKEKKTQIGVSIRGAYDTISSPLGLITRFFLLAGPYSVGHILPLWPPPPPVRCCDGWGDGMDAWGDSTPTWSTWMGGMHMHQIDSWRALRRAGLNRSVINTKDAVG